MLISPYSVKQPLASGGNIDLALTREQVKNSPGYHEAQPIARDYEKQLHAAYDRQGYWP